MVIMHLTPEQFRWMNSDESKRENIYLGFWRQLPLLLFSWYSTIRQMSLIVFNCTSVCYFSFIIWICVYFIFQRLNFCAASESFQILLVNFSVWLKWWMVFFLLLLLFNQSTPTLHVFITVLCVWLYVWSLFLLQSQCWTSFLTVVNSAPDSVSCLPAPSTEFLNVCISYSLTANV